MTDEVPTNATPDHVEFHYQKAHSYSSVHADGAMASVNPTGNLALTFYNERGIIPRRTFRPVLTAVDGAYQLGPEQTVETLNGIMRQVEATVFVSREVATQLRDLLTRMLDADADQASSTEGN